MLSILLSLVACFETVEECVDGTRSTEVEAHIKDVSQSEIPFALGLHNEVFAQNPDSKNLIHSPYSITSALGMLQLGASGETRSEMSSVLGIGEDEDIWHESKGTIIQELHQPDRCDYQMAIANRLFGQQGFAFHQDFLDNIDSTYGAPLQEVDFMSNPDGSRDLINDWVSEQTKDHIPELLPPGIISSLTRLVLTNAIYLNAPWKSPFDPTNTTDLPFTTEEGDVVDVPTMIQSEMDVKTYEDELISVANIPYDGDELSMNIYLPQEGVSLSDVEASLSAEYLKSIQDGLYYEMVEMNLPKFEIRSPLNLNDPLKELGMEQIFIGGFERMSDEDLLVSSVIHEAWIKVEEKGTEAAAATAVVVDFATSMPEFKYFQVNRAFLFTIQDDITGSLLFMGRVSNPLE